jgi:hypothetical protein
MVADRMLPCAVPPRHPTATIEATLVFYHVQYATYSRDMARSCINRGVRDSHLILYYSVSSYKLLYLSDLTLENGLI